MRLLRNKFRRAKWKMIRRTWLYQAGLKAGKFQASISTLNDVGQRHDEYILAKIEAGLLLSSGALCHCGAILTAEEEHFYGACEACEQKNLAADSGRWDKPGSQCDG